LHGTAEEQHGERPSGDAAGATPWREQQRGEAQAQKGNEMRRHPASCVLMSPNEKAQISDAASNAII